MEHARPVNPIAPLRAAVSRRAIGGRLTTVLLFTGLLAVLYARAAANLALDWWNDPNYAHGFLVPLFSGYLVWRKREELRAVADSGSGWGLFALLGGIGM